MNTNSDSDIVGSGADNIVVISLKKRPDYAVESCSMNKLKVV